MDMMNDNHKSGRSKINSSICSPPYVIYNVFIVFENNRYFNASAKVYFKSNLLICVENLVFLIYIGNRNHSLNLFYLCERFNLFVSPHLAIRTL